MHSQKRGKARAKCPRTSASSIALARHQQQQENKTTAVNSVTTMRAQQLQSHVPNAATASPRPSIWRSSGFSIACSTNLMRVPDRANKFIYITILYSKDTPMNTFRSTLHLIVRLLFTFPQHQAQCGFCCHTKVIGTFAILCLYNIFNLISFYIYYKQGCIFAIMPVR